MPDMDGLEDNFRGLQETQPQLERVDEELEKAVKELRKSKITAESVKMEFQPSRVNAGTLLKNRLRIQRV